MVLGWTGPGGSCSGLEAAGVTLAASVPDTWIGRLMGVVRRIAANIRAVDAAREEEAVAIACGASLAGGRGAVLIQNAGLFNCGGVLAGLVELYRVPCFFIVSYRGDHAGPGLLPRPEGARDGADARGLAAPLSDRRRRHDLESRWAAASKPRRVTGAHVLLITGEDLE